MGDETMAQESIRELQADLARERTARQAAEARAAEVTADNVAALKRYDDQTETVRKERERTTAAEARATAAEAKLRTAEEALAGLRGFLLPLAEQPGYGFGGVVDNPHDFSPDPDCCTPAEIAAHKAACEAWDAGDPVAKDRGCQSLVDEKGAAVGFACGGSWGMGSYVYRDPEAAAHLVRTDTALAALRSQEAPAAGAGANNSPGLARQEEAHEQHEPSAGQPAGVHEVADRAEGVDEAGARRGQPAQREGSAGALGSGDPDGERGGPRGADRAPPGAAGVELDRDRPAGQPAGVAAAADLTSAQPSGVAPAAPDTGRSSNTEEWTARAGDPCMVEGCTEKIAVACLPSEFKACERHFADHERDCRHCGPAQREEGAYPRYCGPCNAGDHGACLVIAIDGGDCNCLCESVPAQPEDGS